MSRSIYGRSIYVNLSDLEAIEKIAALMARRKGIITINYTRAGWIIEFREASEE